METTNNFTLSEEDRQILKDAIKILRKGKRNFNSHGR